MGLNVEPAAYKYATVVGAGLKDGTSWDNAWDNAALWSVLGSNAASISDRWVFVESGTYTDAVARTMDDTSNYCEIIGVAPGTTNQPATIADFAQGSDRPIFDHTSYACTFGFGMSFNNIEFISSATPYAHTTANYNRFRNCKFSTTGDGSALHLGGLRGFIYSCEFIAASGRVLSIPDSAVDSMNTVLYSYFHDSLDGVSAGKEGIIFVGNIFDTITNRAVDSTKAGQKIINNTFYNCGVGLWLSIDSDSVVLNNIFDSCDVGIDDIGGYGVALYDYNNFYNNTKDTDDYFSVKGANCTAVNSNFVDAEGGNFSLDSASALIGAGRGIELGIG